MEISNEEWLVLGNRVCNLDKDIHYYLNENKIQKKHGHIIYNHLSHIRNNFDILICNYYPLDINIINDIKITTVFYNNSTREAELKTINELINIIHILIIDIIIFFNKYKIINNKIINYFNKLRNKLIKIYNINNT